MQKNPSILMSKLRNWISSANGVRKMMKVNGPYAGAKVTHIAEDYRSASVEMNLCWYNTMYVRKSVKRPKN